jgi:hypothetical protein
VGVGSGCHWLPLVAIGCHWLPLVAIGCHWLPLVAILVAIGLELCAFMSGRRFS